MLKQANSAAKTKNNLQKGKAFLQTLQQSLGKDAFTNLMLESITILHQDDPIFLVGFTLFANQGDYQYWILSAMFSLPEEILFLLTMWSDLHLTYWPHVSGCLPKLCSMTVVLKVCYTLKSPGELLKIWMPGLHPSKLNQNIWWVGTKHQCFLNDSPSDCNGQQSLETIVP